MATAARIPNVWVVRADGGRFTDLWVEGGYIAIGWNEIGDLEDLGGPDAIQDALSNQWSWSTQMELGQAAGQIRRFGFEMREGDWVITPAADSRWLFYGQIGSAGAYRFFSGSDGCEFRHRRTVEWREQPLDRWALPIALQNNLRGRITVFSVNSRRDFLAIVAMSEGRSPELVVQQVDATKAVIERILTLDPTEFEFFVKDLMTAVGYEDVERTGGSGDEGVDVVGVLSGASFARVRVFVQAKRYEVGRNVNPKTVQELRGGIPDGGRGAIITTSDFAKRTKKRATAEGFQPIELINGNQLVELLVEHWSEMSDEIRDRLGLKPGLVPA